MKKLIYLLLVSFAFLAVSCSAGSGLTYKQNHSLSKKNVNTVARVKGGSSRIFCRH